MTLTGIREKIEENKKRNEEVCKMAAERGNQEEIIRVHMRLGKISAYEEVLQLLDQFIEEIPWNNP